MYSYPKCLLDLINNLKKLPTIGEKSAERLAFAILNMSDDDINNLSSSIKNLKTKLKKCKICGNITENEICNICDSKDRDMSILCVVEDCKNINSIEKSNVFNGKYHVLDGLISPLDGIGPEDINLNNLLERIKKENISEVIIAINPTIEGETTALYISKLLSNSNVTVSRLAYGIPIGADIEYLDSMTLSMAINNRNKLD